MTALVVPFHEGKSRLSESRHVRRTLGLAMLGDVLAACTAVGDARVVTDDEEAIALAGGLGVAHVDDPGDGQGAAVGAALAGVGPGPVLVVNADLPTIVPQDLRQLLHETPRGGV